MMTCLIKKKKKFHTMVTEVGRNKDSSVIQIDGAPKVLQDGTYIHYTRSVEVLMWTQKQPENKACEAQTRRAECRSAMHILE